MIMVPPDPQVVYDDGENSRIELTELREDKNYAVYYQNWTR